jgi:hypothetical protein
MENQPPKTLHKIEDKSKLMNLYLDQFTEPFIRSEINEIIRINRKIEPNKRVQSKKITCKESLLFVSRHGEPIGYTLSEDLQNKLKTIEVDS